VAARFKVFKRAADGREQRRSMEGLPEQAAMALGIGALLVGDVVPGRDEDDRQVRSQGAHLPAELEAIHFGHPDISDQAIEVLQEAARQEGSRRRIGIHGIAGCLQELCHGLEHTGVIVHNGDP